MLKYLNLRTILINQPITSAMSAKKLSHLTQDEDKFNTDLKEIQMCNDLLFAKYRIDIGWMNCLERSEMATYSIAHKF